MKTLPTTPDPAARTASAQKYVKTSVSRSAATSPKSEQAQGGRSSPAIRKEAALGAKSPNHTIPARDPDPKRIARSPVPGLSTKALQTSRPVRSPEPARTTRSPDPMRLAKTREPVRPTGNPVLGLSTESLQTLRPVRSPEPSRTVRGSGLTRSAQSPSPGPGGYRPSEPEEREGSGKSPEAEMSFQTTAQVMSRMGEVCEPPLPDQSTSRRSISGRTSSLLRKTPSFKENGQNTLSNTNPPIRSPSSTPSPAKRLASPELAQSLSARKARAISISTCSASPTSPTVSSELPSARMASTLNHRAGSPALAPNSYGTTAFPSYHSRSSSLDQSQPTDGAHQTDPPKPTLSQCVRYAKPLAILDDSEGNVNTAHPLLQKARHTGFARNGAGELPLRHYSSEGAFTHSDPDLLRRESEAIVPPKRSSSLLYDREPQLIKDNTFASQISVHSPGVDQSPRIDKRSPTPNLRVQNDSAISLVTRAHAAPAETELGVHPAHRTPVPPSASAVASSPTRSTTSATRDDNATPPPIAMSRLQNLSGTTIKLPTILPPSRFALSPSPESQAKGGFVISKSVPGTSSHSREASEGTNSRTTATNNTPFYLNPASSQALLDFLRSTPPPSPPHPGTKTGLGEPGTVVATSSGGFPGHSNNAIGESSPLRPFPVRQNVFYLGRVLTGAIGVSMEPLDKVKSHESNNERQKRSWRKFLGGSKETKKRMNRINDEKGGKKSKVDGRKNGGLTKVYGVGTGARSVDARIGESGQGDTGFMGMGKDGVWISRKNFLKT